MTKPRFICGCEINHPALDAEGFMVCPTHLMRRYGWRSLPTMDTPAGRRPNFRFAGYTPLEVERIVFFGESRQRNWSSWNFTMRMTSGTTETLKG